MIIIAVLLMVLLLSIALNVLLGWYSKQIVSRMNGLSLFIKPLTKNINEFIGMLDTLMELHLYNNEPRLIELMKQAKDLQTLLNDYKALEETSVPDLSSIYEVVNNNEYEEVDEKETPVKTEQ